MTVTWFTTQEIGHCFQFLILCTSLATQKENDGKDSTSFERNCDVLNEESRKKFPRSDLIKMLIMATHRKQTHKNADNGYS